MATPDSSQHPDGKKNDEHPTSLKSENNLSGLKKTLHGTSYQLKLGIVAGLANAKKSLDQANGFSFAVTAEDPTAGKFDDIVYAFKDGEKTGVLKIQVKHKLGSPVPNIKLSEFTTSKDSNNPFAILKYFASFCDQQQSTTDLEGFIICTNSDIEDKAKKIWKTVETAVTNESTPSLDSYVSSLFDNIGGKCYQLDYDKLSTDDVTLSNFYQLLRKCSKRTRLAKLMIEATTPSKKITANNFLFKEYRQAILNVIDRSKTSKKDSYGFTYEFLVSSSSNSNTNYEAFRKEFEDQYRQEFKIDGCVWDDLKLKRVHVAKDFLLDEKNVYASSASFPDDDVDKYLKCFCKQFRLVCGTYNEHGLDDAIAEVWKNLHFDQDSSGSDRRKGRVEENMAIERLFKTNFNWLKNPFDKPLHSDDIRNDLENFKGILACMELEPISDKLREKFLDTPFRISTKALKASELYKQVQTESLLQIETFDTHFGATVLSDILKLHEKESIFLEESDFLNNSKKVNRVIHSLSQHANCLVVICNGMGMVSTDILKASIKQVILIKKTNDISSVLSPFCLRDLTKASWEQFMNESISLCGTAISSSKIFQNNYTEPNDIVSLCETEVSPGQIIQNNFPELTIEQIIKLLDWGNQMKENNEITKKYREIECTYVHRPWIQEKMELKVEDIHWIEDSSINKVIKECQRKEISFKEIAKILKTECMFREIFKKANYPEEKHEPIVGDQDEKVLILLGAAGLGKSTSITWLAWDLQQRNPSSLVVRCNLSEHCSDFKQFLHNYNNEIGMVIDETEALRMLYKLVYASLQFERNMADKCSKCIAFSDGSANLNEELMKHHGLSLHSSIQLMVFKEKFNTGELVLLLDGFDEIAPHYKEVVLQLLSLFEQFNGVKKLYLTSRPYGFKEQFEKAFKHPSFFQLKPLSLSDKVAFLHKRMEVQWYQENIGDEEASDFYKSMCISLICCLGSISDIPLPLMMAVNILGDRVNRNENIKKDFSSTTFKKKAFETILDISRATFNVEEFVKVKIRHLLYDKNGADPNVLDKPHELEKFENAVNVAKQLHGLVATGLFFDKNELTHLLSETDMQEVNDFMNKIHEGSEKTGLIHRIQDGVPVFIHRSFAEYLAAWWIVKHQIEGKPQGTVKMSSLELLWDRGRKELRLQFETILAKRFPLHLAIIEREWETVASLLSTNPKSLYERDNGKRTPLHLLAYYYDVEHSWPHFLPQTIESDLINAKEELFSWTALDYAFHSDKLALIFYLLQNGASINIDLLYERVISAEKNMISQAAKYARYVMGYLSHEVAVYESHDFCKTMKQFCDQVVTYLVNERSVNFQKPCNADYKKDVIFSSNELSTIQDIIREDSVWMLESIIQQEADQQNIIEMIRKSCFELALECKSIFVLKYLMANDPFVLKNDNIWHCVVHSATKNYKIEFKYFFNLYCSRFKIKDFQPCSIQNYEACYLTNYITPDAVDKVCDFINRICWVKLGIADAIRIDEKILSLLVICVASVRPSMLKYLKESCKLKLSADLVFCVAKATNNLFTNMHRMAVINPTKAYECLLDQASSISDVEATNLLRLAITSNLLQFSKCLIERYNINFHDVDELNGWNVFHLCVLNQCSIWIDEMVNNGYDYYYVDGDKTDLFRWMLDKERDINCFDSLDKKGRSILHLAMENRQRGIVEHIVARKLGLHDLDEIENLSDDDIPNITFCCRAIHEITTSVGEKGDLQEVLCMLTKQIANISQTVREESQEQNNGHLLLQ